MRPPPRLGETTPHAVDDLLVEGELEARLPARAGGADPQGGPELASLLREPPRLGEAPAQRMVSPVVHAGQR